VVFLVVFLAAFFFAMALVTSFQQTNVRTAKLSVNDFFILRAKIFPGDSSPQRRRGAEKTPKENSDLRKSAPFICVICGHSSLCLLCVWAPPRLHFSPELK